ncbi:MAG: DNA-binding protein [Proteobacteria bacterium]|nr:DNA-binding protein [Pseudomonadota bacterium]
MTDYEFTLKFALPGSDDPAAYVEALAASGCDDAVVGIGKRGRIALNFIRSAASSDDAVGSALRDVHKAIPGAKFIEAIPDLVGLTDVAELVGCSRQNMRQIIDFDFPTAVHDGNPELFHLTEVLTWMEESKHKPIDRVLLEVAQTNRAANLKKQMNDIPDRHAFQKSQDACEV